MIEKLTEQQIYLMLNVRNDWINLALRSGKDLSVDEIEEDINWLYGKIGLEKPQIYIFDSLSAQMMEIIKQYGKIGRDVGESIHTQVKKQVEKCVERGVGVHVKQEAVINVKMPVDQQVYWNVQFPVTIQIVEEMLKRMKWYGWCEKLYSLRYGKRDVAYFPLGVGENPGWLSFHDYFNLIGVIDEEDFSMYRNMMGKGIWQMLCYEKGVFITKLPKKVLRDAENRLHSLDEPAVQWRDGNANYFIHGVSFEKDIWKKISKKELSVKEVLQLLSTEQKCAVLREYGDKILEELKCVLVDRSKRGNELYRSEIEIEGRKVMLKLLRYRDPSTGRVYCSFVPNWINEADEGMAWKFGLTKKEYSELEIES